MSTLKVDTIQNVAGVEQSRLVQVQSVTKTSIFTFTATSFTDVTGLTQAITPTNANNKILVFFSTNTSSDGNRAMVSLVRGSTHIYVGDASGSNRERASGFGYTNSDANATSEMVSGVFLDSPSTTSSTTYKIQALVNAGNGAINATQLNNDNTYMPLLPSTLTLMEIRT